MVAKPSGHTALIVEDETDTAEMLAEMIRLCGFQAQHAYSAQPVLDLLRQQKPDLILLDIILPDRNGIELLRSIRSEKQFDDLPVILISGNCQPSEIEKGLLSGASAYLTKPVAFWELKQTIEKLLQRQTAS
ncbi:MAG: response regulator [Anaerolineales bacterium]|nr:response regulator [Anaerolineales bacterium]